MTNLRAAAGVGRLTLRAASSTLGFGSVAPRPHYCAPSPYFVPLSRLSGSFLSGSVCLEELQRAWERDPSSADHWVDAAVADHWVDAAVTAEIDPVGGGGALHPSAGVQILHEGVELLILASAYEVSGLGFEDRAFPDRYYRSNLSNLEKKFFLGGLSGMPGSTLRPCKSCYHGVLDDRVRCDWFWKRRGTEKNISGYASEILNGNLLMTNYDLPARRDQLWPVFKSPEQNSHSRTRTYSELANVGYSLKNDPSLFFFLEISM